ncbi:hypothetical protein EVAR_65255_1 [Eumeta japonica]|uniref:Uncharacterized protein n=1 Tax=Eumeta variegata TaxID=151549 RepID=A0A4C2A2N8_EUMVA|nr:hypothetical protein EVAR_65255_1 [Eumeta japonica]
MSWGGIWTSNLPWISLQKNACIWTSQGVIPDRTLEIIQSSDCRESRNEAVKNSVLHRDLPSIQKYMRDASERFFSIAESHPNPLLSYSASYEAHFPIT